MFPPALEEDELVFNEPASLLAGILPDDCEGVGDPNDSEVASRFSLLDLRRRLRTFAGGGCTVKILPFIVYLPGGMFLAQKKAPPPHSTTLTGIRIIVLGLLLLLLLLLVLLSLA